MLNIEKEREDLVAEIELFIAEAMKAYVIERWADSYQNTEPFAYTIDDKNEVWWMKTQAHQLWQFWKSAKFQEAKKLDGCVVVPVKSCKWTKDEDSSWWTSCGEGFVFNVDPHPYKHNFKNCCFCGGLLEAKVDAEG